ncbi:hypothetical protein [Luteimonas aquatica]|uniref:hypothetical protein n=1 Tax=Luteimonas aquatica TaxID=450364 RepID=UPI001F58A9E8|nr:hypothetical protein [Luteimonas aquatica]
MTAPEDAADRAPASRSDAGAASAFASANAFRWLLVLHVALIAGAVAAGLAPGGYSPALADAYAQEPMGWLDGLSASAQSPQVGLWLTLALVIGLAGLMLAGIVGMFLFKRWGRTLSLAITLAGLVLSAFAGPSLTSPVEGMLWEASTLAWGAILAMAYCTPLQARFAAGAMASS